MTSFSAEVEDAVRRIRVKREQECLQYGEETIPPEGDWADAIRRFPNQEDQEFQRARIEVARHRDVRCLGEYFEAVRSLLPGWVTGIARMHLEYDYNA